MSKELKVIYNEDWDSYEHIKQFYKNGWKCEVDEREIPMTIVCIATDMYEATGEDEYKDYPVGPEIGLLNRDCHNSISKYMDNEDYSEKFSTLHDVNGYCGLATYILDEILQIDKENKKLLSELKIQDACLKSYECRFTKKTKFYPAFKTQEKAMKFMTKLVEEYGDSIMDLIDSYLDKPINLAGKTGWETVEFCEKGIK
jgi:hypothetical protein